MTDKEPILTDPPEWALDVAVKTISFKDYKHFLGAAPWRNPKLWAVIIAYARAIELWEEGFGRD